MRITWEGLKNFIFSFPVEGVKGFIFDMGVHLVSFQLDECVCLPSVVVLKLTRQRAPNNPGSLREIAD
jgi:hypothetical protein